MCVLLPPPPPSSLLLLLRKSRMAWCSSARSYLCPTSATEDNFSSTTASAVRPWGKRRGRRRERNREGGERRGRTRGGRRRVLIQLRFSSGYVRTYIGVSAPCVCSSLNQLPHNGYMAISGCINQGGYPITLGSSLVVNCSPRFQEAANNVWRERTISMLEAVETQEGRKLIGQMS